jgi:hypothetical protein
MSESGPWNPSSHERTGRTPVPARAESVRMPAAAPGPVGGITLSITPVVLSMFKVAVIAAAGLLILVTLLSDLGITFDDNMLLQQFDLKREGNVAVWYSSAILLLCGIAATAIAIREAAGTRRWVPALWTLVALIFVFISADESAQLHEKAARIFTQRYGSVRGLTDGAAGDFAWLLLFLPMIVIFIASVAILAWSHLRDHARVRRLLLAGALCWIGVVVAEFVQAQLSRRGLERSIQGAIEEGLEVVGAMLFLFAFLEYLRVDRQLPRAGSSSDAV